MLAHKSTIRIGGLKANKAIVCLSQFAPAMGPKQWIRKKEHKNSFTATCRFFFLSLSLFYFVHFEAPNGCRRLPVSLTSIRLVSIFTYKCHIVLWNLIVVLEFIRDFNDIALQFVPELITRPSLCQFSIKSFNSRIKRFIHSIADYDQRW